MASTSDSQRAIAQKTWELSNNILEISSGEEIYKYDKQQQQQMLAAKPWEKDHHFFKDIKVSISENGGSIDLTTSRTLPSILYLLGLRNS